MFDLQRFGARRRWRMTRFGRRRRLPLRPPPPPRSTAAGPAPPNGRAPRPLDAGRLDLSLVRLAFRGAGVARRRFGRAAGVRGAGVALRRFGRAAGVRGPGVALRRFGRVTGVRGAGSRRAWTAQRRSAEERPMNLPRRRIQTGRVHRRLRAKPPPAVQPPAPGSLPPSFPQVNLCQAVRPG